jgi:putative methyltransferase
MAGKPKRTSILKRGRGDAAGSIPKSAKRIKTSSVQPQQQPSVHRQAPRAKPQRSHVVIASVVCRQAAHAIGRLLAADASKQGGIAVKSLTLAPHIKEKKATHAVTCRTLKHLPVLRQLVPAVGLLDGSVPGMTPEVAYVLAYDALFGEGLRPSGPLERAVIKQKVGAAPPAALPGFESRQLASAADAGGSSKQRCGNLHLLQDALEAELEALLEASGPLEQLIAPDGVAVSWPRSARVNTLKMSVQEALQWVRSPPIPHAVWAEKASRRCCHR